jgi:hypothetical protein
MRHQGMRAPGGNVRRLHPCTDPCAEVGQQLGIGFLRAFGRSRLRISAPAFCVSPLAFCASTSSPTRVLFDHFLLSATFKDVFLPKQRL